jgi:quinol monooxygenase YgiN
MQYVKKQRVTILINCKIKYDKLAFAKQELNKVIQTVLTKEKACQYIRVHRNLDNPQNLLIIEY